MCHVFSMEKKNLETPIDSTARGQKFNAEASSGIKRNKTKKIYIKKLPMCSSKTNQSELDFAGLIIICES